MNPSEKSSSAFRPRRVHVVSHTQWDREWYLTFQEFRVNLTRVVKKVLHALETEPGFDHFLLDGQAVVLEDHLQVCPEDADRIGEHVASGALQIGPWYMLPDEFLVSGEALVRNLVYGSQVCERFGGAQSVGYMADSFGHPAQIPQILREGGLDSFVYTRGNGSELEEVGHEYVWEAPDGSQVTAVQQCGGYCDGAGLGHEEIWHAHTRREIQIPLAIAKLHKWFGEVGRLSNGDVVLLNNGCDHFPPQRELGRILGALRTEFPDVEFVHSTLERYLTDVREGGFASQVHRGELCQGRYFHILSGVWSARMPLKQRNDAVQRRLFDVEALCAATHFAHGHAYPLGTLTHCWKTLLRNHPHDSICGCSTDEVHRDMIPRFDEAERTAEQVIRREMEMLVPAFAQKAADDRETALCVFNPLPYRRRETLERLVILQPFGIAIEDLRMLDEQGREVPMRILRAECVERFWGVDYRVMLDADAQKRKLATYASEFHDRFVKTPDDHATADCFLHIEWVAEMPAAGHARYRLTDAPPSGKIEAGAMAPMQEHYGAQENDLVRVTVRRDDRIDVLDKRTGRTFRDLLGIELVGDCGDEYDFSPAPRPSAEPRIATRVTLRRGSPVIDIELRLREAIPDSRLRVLFPHLARAAHVVSDGHFYVNERSIHRPPDHAFVQPHPETFPQQDFSLVQDDDGGLAVFVQGLPEVAPLPEDDGQLGLAVTLLRSVGWLSRDDFPTRRSQNAGPTISTPDAQCEGTHTFRLALVPFSGDWRDAGLRRLSERWRHPPLVIQGVLDGSVRGGFDVVAVDDPLVSATAIKRHEERDTMIVRLFSDATQPREAGVRSDLPIAAAWRVDALERRQHTLVVADGRIGVPLRAHGIASIEIEFAT